MARVKNKEQPLLGIGVLQWNASEHTIALLQDLRHSFDVIAICDNGSEQHHVESILNYLLSTGREVFHEPCPVRMQTSVLIQNRCNSGFAAGINLCISSLLEKQVDWVWLLNNDTRVDSDSITHMHELIEGLPPGVYGTMMQDMSSTERSFGNQFSLLTSRYKPISTFSGDYEKLGDWYLDGASMLIHREILEKVGLLSDDFFIYFEELDYKRRIAEYGYRLKLLPDVVVRHEQAGSSSQSSFVAQKMYHETYSTLTFYKKHHIFYLPIILLVRTPIRLLTLFFKLRFQELRPVIIATFDFLMKNKTKFCPPLVTGRRYFCSKNAN